MYYYSKKSRKKIIHTMECFHFYNTDIKDIGWFESLPKAYKKGYRLCKHCNPLFNYYKKEREQVLKFCKANGLAIHLSNRSILVDTFQSKWKIALDNRKRLVLYHQNEFVSTKPSNSEISGYHLQSDARRRSIVAYLNYIVEHDAFRTVNPIHMPKKVVSTPPRKGSKKYKSAQKRIEKRERRKAIRNVLTLIESLSVPSAQTPAMAV